MDEHNQNQMKKLLYHKNWNLNTIVGAEAITLLELMEVLKRRARHIENGKITIGFDNRIAHQQMINEVVKPTMFANDAGAEIAQIRDIMKEIKFEVKLQLVRGHTPLNRLFRDMLLQHLVKAYHEEDERVRVNIE